MVTEGIGIHTYRKQYRGEVEELVGCTGREFDAIDWGTLASVMRKTKWGPALRKLVWGDNPCRVCQYLQMRSKSNECPLCGCKDTSEHFLECEVVNTSTAWEEKLTTMQTSMRAKHTPAFFMEGITSALKGRNFKYNKRSCAARNALSMMGRSKLSQSASLTPLLFQH